MVNEVLFLICFFSLFILYLLDTAGKEAMKVGVGRFNQVASKAHNLDEETRRTYRDAATKENEKGKPMTARDIKKKGAKVFKKIQEQVNIWNGYGIAYMWLHSKLSL